MHYGPLPRRRNPLCRPPVTEQHEELVKVPRLAQYKLWFQSSDWTHGRRTWHPVLQCPPTIERHSEPLSPTRRARLLEPSPWQIARRGFPLAPEAVEAWELQLPPFIQGCRQLVSELPEAVEFEILLEYPIPRVGKRVDAVLLMHDVIVAIETKTGACATTAERQVDDYAINLACIHEPSANRTVRVGPDEAD